MPLIPRGLSPRFIDRIKQEVKNLSLPGVVQRTIDRFKTEVPSPSLRIVRPDEVDNVQMNPIPSSVADVMARIEKAGREQKILRARYNGVERDLEPDCFRYWDKDDDAIPLLYAYCDKDKAFEAFKLKKFESLLVTNRRFALGRPKALNELSR